MRRVFSFMAGYVVLSALCSLSWLVFSFPDYPRAVSGWLWLLVLALPLHIAYELIGELLWNSKLTNVVERKTEHKRFSWVRVAYGFLIMGAVFVLVLGIPIWFKSH